MQIIATFNIEVAIDTGAQVATRAIKYLFSPMNYTTSWYVVVYVI